MVKKKKSVKSNKKQLKLSVEETKKLILPLIEKYQNIETQLESTNEIKEIAKKSNLSSSEIFKWINQNIKVKKESEKCIDKSSVTDNTNVTHDTNDTNNTNGFVTRVLRDKQLLGSIFGENTLEQILEVLATNEGTFTYDKIAKELQKDVANIKQAISRKKECFDLKKPDGKICHVFLSRMIRDEIMERIKQIESQMAKKQAFGEKKKQAEESLKNYDIRIKGLIQRIKPRIEKNHIIIDFQDIASFEPTIADMFLDNPTKVIDSLESYYDHTVEVRITNIPSHLTIPIENIRAENLNKVISIEGRITSFGEVKPIITEIEFECCKCGCHKEVYQNYRKGTLEYPGKCFCSVSQWTILKKKKVNACFIQLEDLQEKTDNPHSRRIKGVLFNGMCDSETIKIFNPGNEVRCVGILKEVPIKKQGKSTLFEDWIFEVVSAELIDKDVDLTEISEEDKNSIKELSEGIDKEGVDFILPSFAPEVYGYDAVKGAIILQLCNKRNDKKNSSVKNKSNILLIGDPGIAKSVLCDFSLSITSGGRKAVGGGSSAVGITASVVKEEDSLGGYRVEPGAMVLAKDLLFLDELNNLSEEDKPKLQEGMSEQQISINKANLHVQMKVSCGILAAANPKNGHFIEDGEETIEEQFNIPSPILNRFDSIFVLRDKVNEETDKKIAERMTRRHRGKLDIKYDKHFLRKFFTYIKYLPEPELSDEIERSIQQIYSLARSTYNPGVKINPRFLESLIRMSTSSAKLRQSLKVEIKDIDVALKILAKSQYKIKEMLTLELK